MSYCCLNTSVQRKNIINLFWRQLNQSTCLVRWTTTWLLQWFIWNQVRIWFIIWPRPYFLPAVFERSNHHCYNTPINWSTVHFVLDRQYRTAFSLINCLMPRSIRDKALKRWVSNANRLPSYITLLDNIRGTLGVTSRSCTWDYNFNLVVNLLWIGSTLKNLDGSFYQTHLQVSGSWNYRTYLFAQLGVFLLSLFASVFLWVEIGVAFLVLLLFTGLSLLQLHVQMQRRKQIIVAFWRRVNMIELKQVSKSFLENELFSDLNDIWGWKSLCLNWFKW